MVGVFGPVPRTGTVKVVISADSLIYYYAVWNGNRTVFARGTGKSYAYTRQGNRLTLRPTGEVMEIKELTEQSLTLAQPDPVPLAPGSPYSRVDFEYTYTR
ncbi:hypothetical protein BEN47_15555 [Hymenobacter lapidarius]|uniref:Uncharacterized protein n=1 Tax=Hymenobacter lapidarius TaxID=1908237 RepID=A0A1G1T272_9BACT|nr:hypothetical protein BEN47_15555 [Hymenobacter lapidarius]